MFSKRTRVAAVMAAVAGMALAAGGSAGANPVPGSALANRGDIKNLPDPLKERLVQLAGRPHTYDPMTAFAEAATPSKLFQYYLIDTRHFQPNQFTVTIPGVNDGTAPTATGPNHDLPTIGAVRVVLEPKPGLPTDPHNIRAFIDVFTDISGLFVINDESGWYEGWMIHDLRVEPSAPPRPNGHAQFGRLTAADLTKVEAMGDGHNTPGHFFTVDGMDAHFPTESDIFPHMQGNTVPIFLSMGAYNSTQQSDAHSYWEFNYTTDWVWPLYELPFTGGTNEDFQNGELGARSSIVPGSGPGGIQNSPVKYGDNPFLPRDPDKFDGDNDAQREFRYRSIPSGLAHEIYLDVFERLASFEPGTSGEKRLFDAYAYEVSLVDQNGDGVISAVEGDPDSASDGFKDNTRLYLDAPSFDRFAVTREINDGILAPRFAPSTQAWILSGYRMLVSPSISASAGRDGDDR